MRSKNMTAFNLAKTTVCCRAFLLALLFLVGLNLETNIHAQCLGPVLQGPVNYAAEPSVTGVATADFNGDGKLDLAVKKQRENTLSILVRYGVIRIWPPSSLFFRQ